MPDRPRRTLRVDLRLRRSAQPRSPVARCLLPVACSLIAMTGCTSTTDRPPYTRPPEQDAAVATDAGEPELPPEDPGPPLPSPDLVFVLPYQGAPETVGLDFMVGVRALDVHFSVDTTGSFAGEIDELQSSLLDVVLPGIRAAVADASFGVSRFEDFPLFPLGGLDDRPFVLHQRQTLDDERAAAGVRALDSPLGYGGDFPEASAEALYQIATGEGFILDGVTIVPRFDPEGGIGTLGGAGFRSGALPVVIQVTDAPPHGQNEYAAIEDAHSMETIERAAIDAGLLVLGVASGGEARPYLRRMASATGAVAPANEDGACETGLGGAAVPSGDGLCPLVYDIDPDGAGLSTTIVDAVEALLSSIVFESVSVLVHGDDLGFVIEAIPEEATVPDDTDPPGLADLHPAGGDGVVDSFTNVRQGTGLRFRLVLRNDVVRETDYEQIFFLRARIVADGRTILDDRLLQVTVPARAPAVRDAGVDAGADAGSDGG